MSRQNPTKIEVTDLDGTVRKGVCAANKRLAIVVRRDDDGLRTVLRTDSTVTARAGGRKAAAEHGLAWGVFLASGRIAGAWTSDGTFWPVRRGVTAVSA